MSASPMTMMQALAGTSGTGGYSPIAGIDNSTVFGAMPSPMNYWQNTPLAQQGYESMMQYNADPAAYNQQMQQNGSILSPSMLQGISQGLGAFTSLAQIYGMFQNLGLQKKAFKFAREGTKRNFNAQATAFNEASASKETARRAYAEANGQDYNSMYAYGTGKKIENWT